jgi:NAD(P)-binding Rossmann-like domain/GMC oxidoreductase
VVVVGSGFGASASACRLAQAGRSVLVLERGRSYPAGSFPCSPQKLASNLWDPSAELYGVFDVWAFSGIESVVSSGLGSGSLISAKVMLRKDPDWFVDDAPDSPPQPWPITYADLEPHYEAAEAMLGVQRFCGECDVGCNDGAKNTFDYTYLSRAVDAGAQIRTLCEVLRIDPRGSGDWYRVTYVHHDPDSPRAARSVVSDHRCLRRASGRTH